MMKEAALQNNATNKAAVKWRINCRNVRSAFPFSFWYSTMKRWRPMAGRLRLAWQGAESQAGGKKHKINKKNKKQNEWIKYQQILWSFACFWPLQQRYTPRHCFTDEVQMSLYLFMYHKEKCWCKMSFINRLILISFTYIFFSNWHFLGELFLFLLVFIF